MTIDLNVYTDGGSRGNPGEGAIGVYIEDDKKNRLAGFGKRIGVVTNNVAEYRAVLEALSWIYENKKNIIGVTKILFFLDSRLVCFQLAGVFKIKNENLRSYFYSIKEKEKLIGIPIRYNNIPRELNKKADDFVNKALDNII